MVTIDMKKKVEIDYGFSCGRNWITIDGKELSQTGGAAIYMKDEDVAKIIKTVCDPDWKVYVFDENRNLVEWEVGDK
jgi:hypothetical protein